MQPESVVISVAAMIGVAALSQIQRSAKSAVSTSVRQFASERSRCTTRWGELMEVKAAGALVLVELMEFDPLSPLNSPAPAIRTGVVLEEVALGTWWTCD